MVEALPSQRFEITSGATFWFTGFSGAGKSTLSEAVKKRLDSMLGDKNKCFILDGDIIRTGLNKGLGFSAEDRAENIRRISEVAKLFAIAGQICIVAFISPYAEHRNFGKKIHKDAGIPFYECFINSPLEVCEARDVKGLYKKARAGELKNFTGISDPYEAPVDPALDIRTDQLNIDQCVDMVVKQMIDDHIIQDNQAPSIAQCLYELEISDDFKNELATIKSIEIDLEQVEYLQTIAQGWAYPLEKFMDEMQLLEVMQMKTLTDSEGNRHLFSVPITQSVTKEQQAELKGEKKIGLRCSLVHDGILAVIENPVFFENRKEEISARTFGTFSGKHPKVERILAQGDFLVSGSKMRFIHEIKFNDGLDQYRLTPAEVNAQIIAKGADAVYAFQVRNPLHNGHVAMLKDTREKLLSIGYKNPILLLHPLGGWQKEDDVPLGPRMKQHQALLDDGTLDQEHTILAIWPSPMYYAGPTEVLWHASSRSHCGITHFVTGRDPAGLKHPENPKIDCYDVWHGQKLLKHVKGMINNVQICDFKVAALNKHSNKMEFLTPASNNADYLFISGTAMRTMAKNGEEPPAGFMSPQGWVVLAEYYRSLSD